MNYASEAFSALIRPLTQRSNSRGGNNSGQETRGQSSTPSHDLEEDGFLVVGQTSSEKTTVYARDFSGKVDSPPEYHQLQETENPPSYMEFKQATPTYQPWGGASSPFMAPPTPTQNISNMEAGSYNTIALSHAALTGVPFTLATHLQKAVSIATEVDSVRGLRFSSCDLSKYDYDFDLEMRVISEYVH